MKDTEKEKKGTRPWTLPQIVLHVGVWAFLLWLAIAYWQGTLGSNPVRALTLQTGKTALILLLLSLACTPLYLLFGWKWVYAVRRPLGVYATLYATIHFLIFAGLDYGFDWPLIGEMLRTNLFTLVGLLALFILIPLTLTSTRGAMVWLGETRWRWLHRGAYIAAVLAVLHYALLVRQYYTQPLIFGGILAVLFGIRLVVPYWQRSKAVQTEK